MARSEHHPNGLIHYNPQLSYRGYTLFCADDHQTLLLDMEGSVVHRWQFDGGINNAELLPSGNLIALMKRPPDISGQRGLNGLAAGVVELDWNSNVVWKFEDPWIHHDYERLSNGNTLMIKWEPIPKTLVKRIKGGYHHEDDDSGQMMGDVVIEVTPAGEILRNWKSWSQLDTTKDVICPIEHRREWTHANSISVAPNGDWLVSLRNTSTIVQVNPRSGKVRWRWNGVTSHQHDVNYSSEKTITIFDNGLHRRGIDFSRVIEIDAKTKEVVWEYTDNPPFSFFTVMGGSARVLPNGNVFICETAKGQFFEVTRDKKVVWEYINPFFSENPRLGAGRMNNVYRVHRYGVDYLGLDGRDLNPDNFANLNRLYS